MKSLKQLQQITGIKADNLRQRIHRGTLEAEKRGRDWFVREMTIKKLIKRLNETNKV